MQSARAFKLMKGSQRMAFTLLLQVDIRSIPHIAGFGDTHIAVDF
jgi:hypothetical protein